MKVAKPPQAPPVKEAGFIMQPAASPKSLKRDPANHIGLGVKDEVKISKKKQNEPEKSSGETGSKKEGLDTLGSSSRRTFSEELREKKTQLKKINHLHKDVVSAPKKDKSNIEIDHKNGFDSDSSYESDTYVNLWENIPNMRGGGKFPDKTK